MIFKKNKILNFFFIFCILTTIAFLINIYLNQFEKNKIKTEKSITINLFTSVHPSLPWGFKAKESKIVMKVGEVRTIEYVVENLDNKAATGIATFAYFPKQFGNYIRKLNCFCYDAQTLKPNQKDKFTLVLLIDPEAAKDSKTKNIKEVTIQFTFFDYKEYKENKS
jgi:cytochrome c oxidase assembly protein subunit 11